MEEEGFVGGAAAFGDEGEVVFVAGGGGYVDLGGEVVAGVFFLKHGEGGDLGVAEVAFGEGAVDAAGEGFFFVEVGPDLGAFGAGDEGGAGVLAGGEFADGGDDGVFEKGVGDEAVVFAGFGVVKYGGDLLEVAGAEVEGDIAEGFVGELFEGLGFDDEDFFAVESLGANAVVGNFAPGGLDALVLIDGRVLVFAHEGFLVVLNSDCINYCLFKTTELNIRVKGCFFGLRGDE